MTEAPPQPPPLLDRMGMWLGPVATVALVALFSTWTEDRSHRAGLDALWLLLTAAPWALAWLAAAIGYGRPLRAILLNGATEAAAIQIGLGVAALLTLDAAAGALGLLQLGGAIGAWILLLPGWLLLADQVRRHLNGESRPVPASTPHWLNWTTAPAIAVLVSACCSAPGWLWHSEFGGYDALSYHLQLPREWLELGRITGLEHNVYSFLPGYVEAAYYHLAVLTGGGVQYTYAAQFLHTGFTLLAALTVARLALRLGGPRKRLIAAVAFVLALATPWVIVVGSLAYNEMAVALMLATGLLALEEEEMAPARLGVCAGILAAAACASKLTALGFVALPLAMLLAFRLRNQSVRNWLVSLAAAGGCGLLCLLPYLVRNWLEAGNPLFPFATATFGTGHWTARQAAIFSAGHLSTLPLPARAAEAWHQLMRYGIGPNPHPAEPWHAQWSILPWLVLAALLLCLLRRSLRPLAFRFGTVLLLQLSFWFFFTHVKSRFMIPAVVPASLLCAVSLRVAIDQISGIPAKRLAAILIGLALLAYSALVLFIFRGEPYAPSEDGRLLRAPGAMIGRAGLLNGNELSFEQRTALAEALPAVYVNHLLPPDARVLLVGEAAVLYYRDDVTYQTTWDRGPISRAMESSPDDPRQWLNALRSDGFTHLLVNEEMLQRWQEAGWNDPNLTVERINRAAAEVGRVEQSWPGLRMTLYSIAPRTPVRP